MSIVYFLVGMALGFLVGTITNRMRQMEYIQDFSQGLMTHTERQRLLWERMIKGEQVWDQINEALVDQNEFLSGFLNRG